MCTVSYLPLDDGYIITSNRDETPDRNITDLSTKTSGEQKIYFPKDPHGGGSWIAFSDFGNTACLLNGAFEPYDRSVGYPKSRGIVLLDSFNYSTPHAFATEYSFAGAAPFTLILMLGGALSELIWDGHKVHHTTLDPAKTGFWSSVTLYGPEAREWRAGLFHNWLDAQSDYIQSEIIEFHKYGSGDDDKNGFVMNRNEVKTLSISSVQCTTSTESEFWHMDLQNSADAIHGVVTHKTQFVQPS